MELEMAMEKSEGMDQILGELVSTKSNTTLVPAGKKGVTNAQMIPVLRSTIQVEDSSKLILLKQYYPEVYASSLKYLSKPQAEKLAKLI